MSTYIAKTNQPPYLPLQDGNIIPQVGFGTYKLAPSDCDRALGKAFELGIRHIDTAQMYQNEAAVGAAIKAHNVPRNDLFLTTKLNNGNHLPMDARRTFQQSLRDLQVDYVDLFLIHWPVPMHYNGDFVQTWEVIIEFQQAGIAKTIGVSNFEPEHIEKLITATGVAPAVNQVEAHPYFHNSATCLYNQNHNIITEAWSPLARGRVASDPILQNLAKTLGHSPAQVALRWALQKGWVIFPKSTNPTRITENWDIFDFVLSSEDMATIDSLNEGEAGRTGRHPNVMDRL